MIYLHYWLTTSYLLYTHNFDPLWIKIIDSRIALPCWSSEAAVEILARTEVLGEVRCSIFCAISPFSVHNRKRSPMKLKQTPQQTPALYDSKHKQKSNRIGEYRYLDSRKLKLRYKNPRKHSAEPIAWRKVSMGEFWIHNTIIVEQNILISYC